MYRIVLMSSGAYVFSMDGNVSDNSEDIQGFVDDMNPVILVEDLDSIESLGLDLIK